MKSNGVYNDTTEACCNHTEEPTEVWRDPDTLCGIGRFRPAFLQVSFISGLMFWLIQQKYLVWRP